MTRLYSSTCENCKKPFRIRPEVFADSKALAAPFVPNQTDADVIADFLFCGTCLDTRKVTP